MSFAIIIPLILIIPLWIVNSILYNNVMSMTLPIVVIIATVIGMRNAKEMSAYIYVVSILLISFAVYLVLPDFTIAKSKDKIKKELSEVVKVELLENTLIDKDDIFSSKWFYTYRVTESNGIEYQIMFNPKSGEFSKKS